MKLRATADLGALGAKEGPAIAYQWSPPSRLPRLLPALALLLFLLPKRNRSLQALWLAVPLGVTLAFESLCWAIPGLGKGPDVALREICIAMPFGLAAVWLVSPYLKARNRFLTFLEMLATMELFCLFVCAVRRQWDGDRGPTDMLIGTAVVGLVLILTVNLAGWSCRQRYGRGRFLFRLTLWIMAGWLAFFIVMALSSGPGPLGEMAVALAIISAVSLALLLPFLLLSAASAFYRQRLKEVLRLADAPPPPVELENEC